MGISWSVGIVSAIFSFGSFIKERYCPICQLTDVMFFSHDQNEKEIYGYKFKTHEAHTETTTGYIKTNDGLYTRYDEVEVNYTVPKYQENLGLHKTTTKEKVYVCERCGYQKISRSSNTEKVDM